MLHRIEQMCSNSNKPLAMVGFNEPPTGCKILNVFIPTRKSNALDLNAVYTRLVELITRQARVFPTLPPKRESKEHT